MDSLDPYIPSKRLETYHPKVILYKLGVIRRYIEEFKSREGDLLLTVFDNVAERYSYLKHILAPEFSRDKLPSRDPVEYYLERLLEAINDLRNHSFNGYVEVIWSDSTIWLLKGYVVY